MAMKIDRARLFDKRVVQRNIRAGRVTKDEYRAWLADQSDVGEKIMAREEGGDDDGYEIPPRAPVSISALSAAHLAGLGSVAHAASSDDDDDDDDDDEDDDDVEDDDADDAEDDAADEADEAEKTDQAG